MFHEEDKLHPNAIEKIENKIKGSLINCHIKDNWPQYESFSKHVESLGKEVLKHKKDWLDINDIFSIFYDFVYEATSGKARENEKLEGNLWDLLGEEEARQLVKEIKEYLVGIPREFDVYIPLPRISQNLPANIKLSESISLEVYEEANKVPGGYQGGLRGIFNTKLELKKVYLRQRLTGYCGNRLENASNKKAVSNFKITLQQGIFRELLKINPDEKSELGLLGGYSHHQVPKVHLVSIDVERKPQKVLKTEFPLDLSKWINSVDLNWDGPELTKAVADGAVEPVVKNFLKRPIELIECNVEESIRVKSAIQWCFDSYISENKTLSFLQVCIGLEALLGDDGYNGSLTEILADRCSYLISSDIKGRKTIKKNFKELYDARSKLVHGNATELDSNQRYFLNWGRTILEYAIVKEIKHLQLDKT
jgi:hypothetical protein